MPSVDPNNISWITFFTLLTFLISSSYDTLGGESYEIFFRRSLDLFEECFIQVYSALSILKFSTYQNFNLLYLISNTNKIIL